MFFIFEVSKFNIFVLASPRHPEALLVFNCPYPNLLVVFHNNTWSIFRLQTHVWGGLGDIISYGTLFCLNFPRSMGRNFTAPFPIGWTCPRISGLHSTISALYFKWVLGHLSWNWVLRTESLPRRVYNEYILGLARCQLT